MSNTATAATTATATATEELTAFQKAVKANAAAYGLSAGIIGAGAASGGISIAKRIAIRGGITLAAIYAGGAITRELAPDSYVGGTQVLGHQFGGVPLDEAVQRMVGVTGLIWTGLGVMDTAEAEIERFISLTGISMTLAQFVVKGDRASAEKLLTQVKENLPDAAWRFVNKLAKDQLATKEGREEAKNFTESSVGTEVKVALDDLLGDLEDVNEELDRVAGKLESKEKSKVSGKDLTDSGFGKTSKKN